MRYGIRLDGRLITDPEWRSPDDVMRAAHGHGVTRMPGDLVALPERIQRRRTKGWRMPEGAKYVGRPTYWSNPFTVMNGHRQGWLVWDDRDRHGWVDYETSGGYIATRAAKDQALDLAASLFREHAPAYFAHPARAHRLDEIRGRDLACWCPLDQPCHSDVLLDLANGAPS